MEKSLHFPKNSASLLYRKQAGSVIGHEKENGTDPRRVWDRSGGNIDFSGEP